ncbi:MAG TPA: RodZ domain-containing protein [Terriglobales bacterium]|nr:RodZ domain-containing protein [Terriglobales bacterium]
MSGFGEKLRRQREMRGISLEEISASTKIGTRSLRAIEEEDFDKLPGGIFNKGFVRAYSSFLGLDEEETVADFDAAWNKYEEERRPALELHSPKPEQPEAGSRSAWLLVVALILLTAVGGLYLFQRREHQEASSVVPPSAESSESRSNSAPNSSPSLPNRELPAPPKDAAAPSDHSATATTEGQKPGSGVASGAVASAKQNNSTQALPTPQVRPSAPIRLQVFAREDSWLSVSVDGKNVSEGILSAQKMRSIHAQKEVRLKVGNLAGVQVSFNGDRVDVDGQPKEVKELIFTAQGLQR